MKLALSKSTRALVLGAMMSGVPLIGIAQQAPAPDNTKAKTQTDQNTADKQSNTASDRDLTQQVRKAIMEDKAISTYAHNVKVVT